MLENSNERTILITGCSSGIGLDAAFALKERGWRVFATCRQQKDVERLIEQGLESFVLDYSSDESVQEGAAKVLELCQGQLDALFNNGAYAIPGLAEDIPRDAMRAIFETNLFGQFDLINRLLPSMKQHGAGRIINCSSVLGFTAMPFRGAYSSTKFAMEGLTDTLRIEHAGSPIQFSLIEPGPIATRIRENSIPHYEQWIDWEKSAQRSRYEEELNPRLYKPSNKKDRFELQTDAVIRVLVHALESPKPKPRYYVTTPTHIAGLFKRVFSTRWFDRLTSGS